MADAEKFFWKPGQEELASVEAAVCRAVSINVETALKEFLSEPLELVFDRKTDTINLAFNPPMDWDLDNQFIKRTDIISALNEVNADNYGSEILEKMASKLEEAANLLRSRIVRGNDAT